MSSKNITKLNLDAINPIFDLFVALSVLFLLVFVVKAFYFSGYSDPRFPIEAREIAHVSSIMEFADNKNPFDLKGFPQNINLYSSIWPAIIGKSLSLFDITDPLRITLIARNISLISSLIAVLFIFLYGKKKTRLASSGAIGALIFFIAIATKSSLGAWSFGLGMSLYTIGLIIALGTKNNKNLIIASCLIILSAFLKPYFGLGMIIVVPQYITLLNTKGIYRSISLIILFGGVLIGIHQYFFSTYFISTIGTHIYYSLVKQSVDVLTVANIDKINNEFIYLRNFLYPFLGFMLLTGVSVIVRSATSKKLQPLLTLISICIFIYYIVIKMWPSTGNFATYSLNLIIPLIIAFILNEKIIFKYLTSLIIISGFVGVIIFSTNSRYTDGLTSDQLLEREVILNKMVNFVGQTPHENIYIDHVIGVPVFNELGFSYNNGNTSWVNMRSLGLSEFHTSKLLKIFFSFEDVENISTNINYMRKKEYSNVVKIICSSLTCSNFSNNEYTVVDVFKLRNLYGQNFPIKFIIKKDHLDQN